MRRLYTPAPKYGFAAYLSSVSVKTPNNASIEQFARAVNFS
jgi:hypothetical protein